jgi:hypothetical protein
MRQTDNLILNTADGILIIKYIKGVFNERQIRDYTGTIKGTALGT